MDRIIQLLINAAALYVAVVIVPNLEFTGEWWKLLVVAFIFGLVNTFLRPILRVLTLPITLMTLGIFLLILNALLLLLVSAISGELNLGFTVGDFLAALLGSIVISLVGLVLSMVIGTGRMAGRLL
ncbi:MAG TPA: phage holin family protein [Candidatus Limnocylindria bacterium]|jgi:putative membrane protein|nr:phage holin family protein [Candidatus Limnocylindria bacterium]